MLQLHRKNLREHFKMYPMKGVYLIQLEDDDVEEALEEDLHISLQAITGISNIETMQLGIAFNNASVRALVDSGSTYSFLSVAIAKRHQLQPFSIRLLCDISLVVCKVVRVHIDGKEFVFNFFMILPDGYDMMLGINWLRTLGPIVWDFERGHMVF
jgi:hypothetical protein